MMVEWWKETVCYQVWPASFKDSNGDGLGDIQGIISELDHIKDLGVGTIWLSPFYSSPQVDLGYDISNYEDVYPPYGTLRDVEQLIDEIHDRDMRVIFDLVINHTSDQHAWFRESRQSRTNSKSDWYIWKESKIVDGKRTAPNNWGASFGGRAWTYAPERDQWYLHLFAPEQPDLNWENPQTRQAIYDSAIRFWMKKGVDGFRCDTANLYSKDQRFQDHWGAKPDSPYPYPGDYVLNGPRIHEFWHEMRREVFSDYKDIMLVGEMGGTSRKEILNYVKGAKELSMVFDFDLYTLGRDPGRPLHEYHGWELPEFKTALMKSQGLIEDDAWASIWLENHDSPRSLTRFGNEAPEFHVQAAKLLAMLTCTCSGTPFMYQGQEIGMSNIPETWSATDLRDVSAKMYLKRIEEQYPGDEEMRKKAWRAVRFLGRDNARTPVQWNDEKHAGFTTGEPWMRVNDNYPTVNVADQVGDKDSIMNFWKRMIRLRQQYPKIFTHGKTTMHDHSNLATITYRKRAEDGQHALVILNMSDDEADASVTAHLDLGALKLLASNVRPQEKLHPWEGRVYLYRERPGHE